MTDNTPTPGNLAEGEFGALIRPDASSAPQAQPSRRRWLLPAMTGLLTLLGAGTLIAAVILPLGTAAAPAPAESPTPTSTSLAPHPIPTIASPGVETPRTDTKAAIAELADPGWVSRIAATGGIPERTLAAYAGAALTTARTHPSCGLGWNTLAAIGHVESEHGTIGGSRIGTDGIALPTIIGIPLNGEGTAEIRDTDQGKLDGDTTWDRAVGPMQFIPETWAQYAQDGNADGITDANQIDDAALTAAVYLCTAGGDLTDPASWIAAINAYNPSVEYNNRVAESANHYATLR